MPGPRSNEALNLRTEAGQCRNTRCWFSGEKTVDEKVLFGCCRVAVMRGSQG